MGRLVRPPIERAGPAVFFPLDGLRFGGPETGHLAFTPSQADLARFQEQGYLTIRQALAPAELARLQEAVARLVARERRRLGLAAGDMVSRFSVVRDDPELLRLVTWPRTFPTVWSVLGWNIQLYISHLVAYPPETWGGTQCREPVWHQDSGRPVLELERPAPRLSVKVAYWLTDTRGSDRGAMEAIPGSHLSDAPPPEAEDPGWDGALRLEARAGDATIFDRRLWHRHGTNTSDTVRTALFFGYGYRWLRPLDYTAMPEELLERCDPVLRQLLGDGVTQVGWYQPEPEDVPLRAWLARNLPPERRWRPPSSQPRQSLARDS